VNIGETEVSSNAIRSAVLGQLLIPFVVLAVIKLLHYLEECMSGLVVSQARHPETCGLPADRDPGLPAAH
jgi:hypothetical protein